MYAIASVLLLSILTFAPQNASLIDWIAAVQSLETRLASAGEAETLRLAGELDAIAAEVAAWSARQPESGRVSVTPRPESPSRQQLIEHAARFREALLDAERRRPGSPFQIGRVVVDVAADAPQAQTAVTITEDEIRDRNYQVLPDALNLVPGVAIQRIGPRNERGVYVRGFDIRQVPLYIDGIPVYLTYDGYFDMDRFLTHNIGEIQLAKGFTSPLYGPNAIGGAVNVVSKEPTQRLNLDLGLGYASGGQKHASLNLGTRWEKYWLQGDLSWLDSDSFPLSGGFQPTPRQPDLTRENAYQTDGKGSIRFGWTPNETDQHTFTYANQRGEKGNPPYAGVDSSVRARFWRWPEWNKQSFYFIGNKGLGDASYLRYRLYYDQFENLLMSFDDITYTAQTLGSSFTSPYDDDTYGTILEFGTRALDRQTIKASFYYKDDTHREGNLGSPQQSFRDQSFSLGVEDTVQFGARAYGVFGFSVDRIDVLNAEFVQNGVITPFPQNTVTAYNPQAGLFYTVSESGRLHFTFARKTRLPTIKDRYSFRMGQAIPNPDLREEISNNWEVGYTHAAGVSTVLDLALFRSDLMDSTQRFFLQPNLFQLQNIGESRHMGIEFGVRSTVKPALQLAANYTYLSRKNESHPEVVPIDTPRHKVYASATHRFLGRFTAMADLRYEANRWMQTDAGRYQPVSPYAVVGIGGAADVYEHTSIQVGVNNLFDRNYFIVEGYPEEGRSGYVNVRYRF